MNKTYEHRLNEQTGINKVCCDNCKKEPWLTQYYDDSDYRICKTIESLTDNSDFDCFAYKFTSWFSCSDFEPNFFDSKFHREEIEDENLYESEEYKKFEYHCKKAGKPFDLMETIDNVIKKIEKPIAAPIGKIHYMKGKPSNNY